MSKLRNDVGEESPNSIRNPERTGKSGEKPVQTAILRDGNGQFLPGSNANPRGRPKGTPNKGTLFAQALLEEAGPEIARLAIQEAKRTGSAAALKLVLERILPVATDRRLHLVQLAEQSPRRKSVVDDDTPRDILHAHNKLVESVASGLLSPGEAQAISQLLEARRRSWESLVLSKRLGELDDQAAESSHKPR